MKKKVKAKRRNYTKLGNYLKKARKSLQVQTGNRFSVADVAEQLIVTKGFVYQVEQGEKKPQDGRIEQWDSVYGVRSVELWKCLGRMPLPFVASYKEAPKASSETIPVDPFSQLTKEEKAELRPFFKFC